MIGPLNYLDIGLLAFALISGLLAMYRGLTREALSIVSWAMAAAAALYFILFRGDIAADLAKQVFNGSETIAKIAIGSVAFLVVLIVVHFITMKFSDAVLDSSVGFVDRMLGFVFGVIRGFLLVVILFMFFRFLADEKDYPLWVKEAQSLTLIVSAADVVQNIVAGLAPEDLKLPIGGSSSGGVADTAPGEDTGEGETQ
ncbi:MAG: CvpA family protein [Hyphomicrobiaceae bacterium]